MIVQDNLFVLDVLDNLIVLDVPQQDWSHMFPIFRADSGSRVTSCGCFSVSMVADGGSSRPVIKMPQQSYNMLFYIKDPLKLELV